MNKKLLLSLFAVLVTMADVKAQRHEVGVRFGTSNLVGDIGRTNYILQTPFGDTKNFGLPVYAGLQYRMNFNPHQTVRFDLGYNHIQFGDAWAKEEYRRNRNFFGTNNIYEAAAIFEYNFYPVNNEQRSMLSPYIFGGVGALLHDVTQASLYHDFRRDPNGVAQAPLNELDFVSTTQYETGKKVSMSIPFGAGLKYKFSHNWAISGEVMLRPTFTDQLDHSTLHIKDVKSTYNQDILQPGSNTSLLQSGVYYLVSQDREAGVRSERNVGDYKSKDWLNSVTLGLTYSFGRPPCYCD